MKNLIETKKQEFIVLESRHGNENGDYFILHKNAFESIHYCDTYDYTGQITGCTDAGCYSLANSQSECLKDLIKALNKHFNYKHFIDVVLRDAISDISDISELKDILHDLSEDYSFDLEEIVRFSKNWIDENEIHPECKAHTYWDGSNWKSIVIEHEFNAEAGEYEEAWGDEDLAEKILQDMPETTPDFEGAIGRIEGESFDYRFTRYQNDPFFCTVFKRSRH